tara:strand:+ start:1192 stop:2274 length:1083 start_codon:yes stop_codon:yes gene_type:complete
MKNSSQKFNQLFATSTTIKESAHARVNLIGEHTDYTGGYVMPSLLTYKTTIYLNENNNKTYSVFSENFNEYFDFNNFIKSTTYDWLDYVKGCLFIFFNENKKIKTKYLKIYIQSNIPIEKGISSSSALCVGIIKALNSFFQTGYNEKHIAILAQKVEKDYIGVSGGIMDQMVSSIGIHGKAFFLDCLSLKYELLDIPSDWQFVLIDSYVQRSMRSSSYNKRYEELKKAEKILNTQHLGTIKESQIHESIFENNIIYKRAKHVVSENQRVLDAKKFLREKNISAFGNVMNKSYISYSKDFDASTKDIDIIVNRSLKSGASGCRLTGGGFGGFTVSLIKKIKYDSWYKKMLNYYDKNKFYKI